MNNDDTVANAVEAVLTSQADSLQRGAVGMWTIFDHPRDKPNSIVARKFEVGNGNSEPVVTDHMLEVFGDEGGLALLRTVLERAGLVCLPREPQDQPNVVETWV